jgi:ATP-dependent Clp protease adaptor protein ClpS
MEDHTHKLIIYNDDVHSYAYIMACLIKFCNHTNVQAEQCALIANNNGKCHVKSGTFLDLYVISNTFETLDIKNEVQEHESYLY